MIINVYWRDTAATATLIHNSWSRSIQPACLVNVTELAHSTAPSTNTLTIVTEVAQLDPVTSIYYIIYYISMVSPTTADDVLAVADVTKERGGSRSNTRASIISSIKVVATSPGATSTFIILFLRANTCTIR